MWLAAWLTEQSVIISLLILCLFSILRHQVALHRVENRIAFIQGLLVTLAANWGEAPESVRRLLDAYMASTGSGLDSITKGAHRAKG